MHEVTARAELLEELRQLLSEHPGIRQLLVSRRTVYNALSRFVAGRVDAPELVEWASLVELQNDEIAYEAGAEQFIADIIFRVATPEINGPIDRDLCRELLSEFPFKNVTKSCEPIPAHRCPCCRSKTLRGRGQFEICPVCFWEDDGQDEDDAEFVKGGPNGALSLRQAQINFANYRACEQRFTDKVREPLPEEL
jgi:hypothetical protein